MSSSSVPPFVQESKMSELTLEALGYTADEARIARHIHDLIIDRPNRYQREARQAVNDCPQPESSYKPLVVGAPPWAADQKVPV